MGRMGRHGIGKTRYEVEAKLLSRVDCCRATWQHLHQELREATDLTFAVVGAADGTLATQQAIVKARLFRQAQENYRSALKDFSHFIISGTLPGDEPS